MIRNIHCWWCGQPYEVDTEAESGPGWIRDSDASWLCTDNQACSRRGLESWARREKRNRPTPPGK